MFSMDFEPVQNGHDLHWNRVFSRNIMIEIKMVFTIVNGHNYVDDRSSVSIVSTVIISSTLCVLLHRFQMRERQLFLCLALCDPLFL